MFSNFSQKTGFDISCKLIYKTCQPLFSGKNKKPIINVSSAELAQRVVKVNVYQVRKIVSNRDFFEQFKMIINRCKRTGYVHMRHRTECLVVNITKTRLYSFDPLKPHFYIVKLGFTGVYIIFQEHRLWVLVRTASPQLKNSHD